jgi:hypothetical protein
VSASETSPRPSWPPSIMAARRSDEAAIITRTHPARQFWPTLRDRSSLALQGLP